MLQTNEPLFKAYYLKEDLCQIWMQENKAAGEEQLKYWCERARNAGYGEGGKYAHGKASRHSCVV